MVCFMVSRFLFYSWSLFRATSDSYSWVFRESISINRSPVSNFTFRSSSLFLSVKVSICNWSFWMALLWSWSNCLSSFLCWSLISLILVASTWDFYSCWVLSNNLMMASWPRRFSSICDLFSCSYNSMNSIFYYNTAFSFSLWWRTCFNCSSFDLNCSTNPWFYSNNAEDCASLSL